MLSFIELFFLIIFAVLAVLVIIIIVAVVFFINIDRITLQKTKKQKQFNKHFITHEQIFSLYFMPV